MEMMFWGPWLKCTTAYVDGGMAVAWYCAAVVLDNEY